MITVRLIETRPDGQQITHDVQARPGQSVMHAAINAGVQGIAADCGGMLTCATCHVRVREPWASQLPAAADDERSMLEFTAAPRTAGSRLSCQLELKPALDGLVADLPETQY